MEADTGDSVLEAMERRVSAILARAPRTEEEEDEARQGHNEILDAVPEGKVGAIAQLRRMACEVLGVRLGGSPKDTVRLKRIIHALDH